MSIPTGQLWFFFRLCGLTVSDENHDLDRPIFDDWTIVTKHQMREQLIPSMQLDDSTHDHSGDIAFLSGCQTYGKLEGDIICPPRFDSYLAIRRGERLGRSKSKVKIDSESQEKWSVTKAREKDKTVQLAIEQSYAVSSLLTIWLLSTSKDNNSCGLSDQVHHPLQFVTALDSDHDFMWTGRSKHSRIGHTKEAVVFTRQEIREALEDGVLSLLTESVMKSRKNKLLQKICQAGMQLADAILASNSSFQLLGAVTCIEMLVGASGVSYEHACKRIVSLIGIEKFEKYQANSVLNQRHRYVHSGEVVEAKYSKLALALAIDCLLEYAEYSKRFKNKDAILSYLDFADQAGLLCNEVSEMKQALTDFLPQHTKKKNLPFFNQFD